MKNSTMPLSPPLQTILDAELAAGNSIVRTVDNPNVQPPQRYVSLAQPFHELYYCTQSPKGMYYGETRDFDPHEVHEPDYRDHYEFEDERLEAPMVPLEQREQFKAAARREGRLLPPEAWMPRPPLEALGMPLRGAVRRKTQHRAAGYLADKIERELKRRGWWQAGPLPEAAYQFKRAFAGDTMAFEQWLQFVFLPRVRGIIAERRNFPSASQVGVYATRELDGRDEAAALVSLLQWFDLLFAPRAWGAAQPAPMSLAQNAGFIAALTVLTAVVLGICLAIFSGVEAVAKRIGPMLPPSIHQQFVLTQPLSGQWRSAEVRIHSTQLKPDHWRTEEANIAFLPTPHKPDEERSDSLAIHPPVLAGGLLCDLPAFTCRQWGLKRAEGQAPLSADAVLDCLQRLGIDPQAPHVRSEAEALVALAKALQGATNRAEISAAGARAAVNGTLPFQVGPLSDGLVTPGIVPAGWRYGVAFALSALAGGVFVWIWLKIVRRLGLGRR